MKIINILKFSLILLVFPATIVFPSSFDSGGIEKITNNSTQVGESSILHGVVFDRTITQIGFSFYKEFISLWQTKTSLHQHSLTLREVPSARKGSVIFIEEGNTKLYKLIIGFRNQKIKKNVTNSFKIIELKLK